MEKIYTEIKINKLVLDLTAGQFADKTEHVFRFNYKHDGLVKFFDNYSKMLIFKPTRER